MKKGKVIGLVIGLALVIFIGFSIKGYYDDRYVGTDFYALVRTNEQIQPEEIMDDRGKVFDKGFSYNLRAYNEAGELVNAEFLVQTDKANELYQNGTYLKISHSKTIVVSQKVITKDEVPAAALRFIEQDTKENK